MSYHVVARTQRSVKDTSLVFIRMTTFIFVRSGPPAFLSLSLLSLLCSTCDRVVWTINQLGVTSWALFSIGQGLEL